MVLPGPAWALPFSSLTPPFPKRPEQQPPYQCHMVPRAGGSSHCQPHTSLGSSCTSGLLSPWRPASSSLPREPACRQPRALGDGGGGGGQKQPAAQRSGSLYRGRWGLDGHRPERLRCLGRAPKKSSLSLSGTLFWAYSLDSGLLYPVPWLSAGKLHMEG